MLNVLRDGVALKNADLQMNGNFYPTTFWPNAMPQILKCEDSQGKDEFRGEIREHKINDFKSLQNQA